MNNLKHFLQYNNAIPIAVSVVLLGAGGAFAATNPEAIVASQQKVVSIDNTYLVSKDLSTYSPQVGIDSVTEDQDFYYVTYSLSTIDVQDAVWKDVKKSETMKVSKADLGQYRDLGVYVTEQLKQIVHRNLDDLKTAQDIEKKNVSQKVIATAYSGLVGKFLETSTETLPGYTPVVVAPVADPQIGTPANNSTAAGGAPQNQAGAPVLQILGNNPARIEIRSSYVDLGAIITSQADVNFGIKTFLNGKSVPDIQIDTSKPAQWIIRYEVTNAAGVVGSAERTVTVFDPNASATTTSNAITLPDQSPSVVSPNTDPATTTTNI